MRQSKSVFRNLTFLLIIILICAGVVIGQKRNRPDINKSADNNTATGGLPINYANAPNAIGINNGMQQGNPNCELNHVDCPSPAPSSSSQPSTSYNQPTYRVSTPNPVYPSYTPSYLYFPPYTPTTVNIPSYSFPASSSSTTPKYTYSEAYSLAQQNCNVMLAARNAANSSALGACIQAEMHNYGF